MAQIEAKWVKPFKIVSTGAAAIAANHGELLLISPTGATTNVTLPSADGLAVNTLIAIKDTSGDLDPANPGAKSITITPNGIDEIDGVGGMYTVESSFEMIRLISDGFNWFKI